ncbi:MAG: hypothetical protein JXR48_07175 [Candidatus Delongbacteria bacterium]|nr:hypothetical protein [Candidatus Delongbacteria bacterium]MBN2834733.1 hypothetical protein [Candidatus Delongbacteria bacterium]
MRVLLLLIISFSLCSQIYLKSGVSYTNNVINLSDDDLDEFEGGEKEYKYDLESSDDIFLKLDAYYLFKYNFLDHTQKLKFGADSEIYFKNQILNSTDLQFSLQQYINKNWNFIVGYTYKPNTYVNRYKCVVDDKYHSMEYSKDGVDLRLNFQFMKNFEFSCETIFQRGFYNKYFTEYDYNSLDYMGQVSYNPSKWFDIVFRYKFRNLEGDGEEAYDFEVSQKKDGSYESDLYMVSFDFNPEVKSESLSSFLIGISYSYENRYFSSKIEGDNFHTGRKDYYNRISSDIIYKMEEVSLGLELRYENRKTDSYDSVVENEKSYDSMTAGLFAKFSLF